MFCLGLFNISDNDWNKRSNFCESIVEDCCYNEWHYAALHDYFKNANKRQLQVESSVQPIYWNYSQLIFYS